MKTASSGGSVTIRDVAIAAGVHVSTVSRALDPARRSLISVEVLRTVERAAERLGYRANRAASALRTGRTRTIGVLIPDITNAVFPPILGGIEASASARGYFVFFANVPDPALAPETIERMLAQQVAGVISAVAIRDDPLTALLLRSNIAAVLVNRSDESGRLSAVVSDDRLAMKLAVDHLVALGHRRIAHLAGPQGVPTGRARRQGFEQALRDHALSPHAVIECDRYSRDAGRAATQGLLADAAGASAIVCCNDLVALGTYDALRSSGLRIPQDLSLTGHNDMPLVDLIDPPLTTIRLPHRELGWRAAEMLLDRIEKTGVEAVSVSTVVLRPELVVRGSTEVVDPSK